MTNEREHEGSFAEGQEDAEHHPEDEDMGDFAEGQESEGTHEAGHHKGSFAEGQEDEETHPEDKDGKRSLTEARGAPDPRGRIGAHRARMTS